MYNRCDYSHGSCFNHLKLSTLDMSKQTFQISLSLMPKLKWGFTLLLVTHCFASIVDSFIQRGQGVSIAFYAKSLLIWPGMRAGMCSPSWPGSTLTISVKRLKQPCLHLMLFSFSCRCKAFIIVGTCKCRWELFLGDMHRMLHVSLNLQTLVPVSSREKLQAPL